MLGTCHHRYKTTTISFVKEQRENRPGQFPASPSFVPSILMTVTNRTVKFASPVFKWFAGKKSRRFRHSLVVGAP